MAKTYKYVLFEVFDGRTQNEIAWEFDHLLKQYGSFEINDVTYTILEVDFFEDTGVGKAIVQMTRYKISDESTQFVHVCPAKKDIEDKMNRDDMVEFRAEVGDEEFDKYVKKWKKQQGRVKMRSYNNLETTCPHCKVVFWKKYNSLPPAVQVDRVGTKAVLKKQRGTNV